MTIPPFTPGSLDTFPVKFNADCCVRRSTISVLDVAGNANSVIFDQGPLKGFFKNILKLYTLRINIIKVTVKAGNTCCFCLANRGELRPISY